jgi:serine/threonine protein phosphatase PrpC
MAPDPGDRSPTAGREHGDAGTPARLTWHDAPSDAPTIGHVRPPMTPVLTSTGGRRLPMHAADGGRIGAWWLSAASVIGTSHLAAGRTRQDDYGFALLHDGSLVAVVTDGLGSYAETAQIGAGLMVQALVAAMAGAGDHQVDDVLTFALLRAQQEAVDLGRRIYGLSAEQLSCTLVACRLTVGGTAELARVGDADAFLWSGEDAEFTMVFADREGAPLNMVTAACPGASADQVERVEVPSATRIVLCSDGLATDIHNSPTLREHLARAWDQPTGATAMLESLRYRRQGSHDDRTGLVVWPYPSSETPGGGDGTVSLDRITPATAS